MAKKTRLMKRVEQQFKRPLEVLLPEKINQNGLSATADELGVSKASLSYWCLRLNLRVVRVCLRPNQRIVIIEGPGNPENQSAPGV